jgi:hypothetical protein
MEVKKEVRNMKRGCIIKECLCLADFVPSIVVAMPGNDAKFRVDMDVPVCTKHRDSLRLVDLMPANILKSIQNMFVGIFISPPTIEHMTLSWGMDMPKKLEVIDSNGKKCGVIDIGKR